MRAMSDTDRKDPAREILQDLFACVLEDILKYGILCVDNRFFVSYTYFTLRHNKLNFRHCVPVFIPVYASELE